MKLLYVSSDLGIPILGRKGASVHVRSLVAALSRAGHSVVIGTPSLSDSPWHEPATTEARVVHVPPGENSAAASRALKELNQTLGLSSSMPGELRRILCNHDLAVRLRQTFDGSRPDLIYERASLFGTVGASLAGKWAVPLLVELNAPLVLEQSTYRSIALRELAEQAERYTLTRASAVLAVSAPIRDHVLSLGVAPDRVHVVPNGVDAALFRPRPRKSEVREQWGLTGGPILGFVGGLRPWHGVHACPELLERLVHHHPDIQLVIVGDGPLRGRLEEEFEARGLQRNVVFTGSLPHEQVADLIPEFDVALAPYAELEHSFYFSPLKLFEYMACGVAVVATALGQIAEVVRDGETGILCPPGDLDALCAACLRLLADPDLRQRLGTAAAEEIGQHYTWERNATRIIELARSLRDEVALP